MQPEGQSDRGRLLIKERAIERIAVTAALQVPGVVRHRGGITRFSGRDLPRAEVSVGENAGGQNSVAVNLFIDVEWPSKISDITTSVHDDVAATLIRLTDLPLHKLDVLVARVSPGQADLAGPVATQHATVPPKPPAASPAALPFALIIAVLLSALAYCSVREILIDNGTISGAPWLRNTIEWASRQHWQSVMFPAAIGAAVIGVLLVAIAFKPRTKTHIGLGGTVWMRPTDIARAVSFRAGRVRGAESARTKVTRRQVRVSVTALENLDPAAAGFTITDKAVLDAVAPVLDVLSGHRTVAVGVEPVHVKPVHSEPVHIEPVHIERVQ